MIDKNENSLLICGRSFKDIKDVDFVYIYDRSDEAATALLQSVMVNVGTQFPIKTMTWDEKEFCVEDITIREINKLLM